MAKKSWFAALAAKKTIRRKKSVKNILLFDATFLKIVFATAFFEKAVKKP